MSLVKHAERELKIAGVFDNGADYAGALGVATLELIKVFADQEHSGMSASMVRNLFHKLANYDPITPLTFKDEEWCDEHGDNSFQNTRNSAVFKEGKDGRPYYIRAYYCKSQTGNTFYTSLCLGDGTRVKKCFI